jgi:hypothetical protein
METILRDRKLPLTDIAGEVDDADALSRSVWPT